VPVGFGFRKKEENIASAIDRFRKAGEKRETHRVLED
jgi:hypothetical protein